MVLHFGGDFAHGILASELFWFNSGLADACFPLLLLPT
jgi:hypothetical protein